MRARALSSDGQLYHAYLKGHSITVGAHSPEALYGLQEENPIRGRIKEPTIEIKQRNSVTAVLTSLFQPVKEDQDENSRSSE